MNKIYIVGMGPGGEEYMTAEAMQAMERADVLCGYTVYIDLAKEIFPQKETYTTPMMQEKNAVFGRWKQQRGAKRLP